MAKKKAFPAEIYVVHGGNEGDEFLATFEEPEGAIECAEHGGRVAVYRFAEIREASITRELRRK